MAYIPGIGNVDPSDFFGQASFTPYGQGSQFAYDYNGKKGYFTPQIARDNSQDGLLDYQMYRTPGSDYVADLKGVNGWTDFGGLYNEPGWDRSGGGMRATLPNSVLPQGIKGGVFSDTPYGERLAPDAPEGSFLGNTLQAFMKGPMIPLSGFLAAGALGAGAAGGALGGVEGSAALGGSLTGGAMGGAGGLGSLGGLGGLEGGAFDMGGSGGIFDHLPNLSGAEMFDPSRVWDPSYWNEMGGLEGLAEPGASGLPGSSTTYGSNLPGNALNQTGKGLNSTLESLFNRGWDGVKDAVSSLTVKDALSGLGAVGTLLGNAQANKSSQAQNAALAASNAARKAFLDNPLAGANAGMPQGAQAMFGPNASFNRTYNPMTSDPTKYGQVGGEQGHKFFTGPQYAAQGGLSMATGMDHPREEHLVMGPGGGQDDTIPARLSDGEFILDADVVAALGDGSTQEGARRLDKMREKIRAHKRSASPKKIPPKAKSPEAYLGVK